MLIFGSLESQFAELNRDIEAYLNMKDYVKVVATVKEAMELCKRLHEEETDSSKKELWKNNAIALRKIYDHAKQHLSEEQVKNVATATKKTIEAIPLKGKEEKQEKKEPNKEIKYECNGINIKQFLSDEATSDVTYEDVCGMDAAKKRIEKEFFLTEKQRKIKEKLKKKNLNFILLYGVPGTGKTFFAQATSNEFKARFEGEDIQFFAVKSGNLKDSKVGQSEKNIIALFEFAKQFERAVLFFDEAEALLPSRAINTGDPTDKQNVPIFLQQLSGFASSQNILVIAATNYPDKIDSAVLSRAKVQIEVPLADKETIYKILSSKLEGLISEEVDLDKLSQKLVGYSNRDIDRFAEELKEELSEEMEKYPEDNWDEILINNEILNRTLPKVKSSVKPIDLLNIAKYSESLGC